MSDEEKKYRNALIKLVDKTHYPQCPFFKKEGDKDQKGYRRIYCEGGTVKFPDIEARRSFVYNLCAHPYGYKTCPIYKFMMEFYKRKYN